MKIYFVVLLSILAFISCDRTIDPDIDPNIDPNVDTIEIVEELYFPPINDNEWETEDMDSLGWHSENVDELYDFLEENNTRAFIVLKDGKIVIEEYWGQTIVGVGSFTETSQWYWASAGKTITSSLVGIAQEEGALDITDPSSMYLGEGWTSMESEKENLITVRDQLSMTTGVDYTMGNTECTEPECLNYKADAGNQWFYHNATYTLLDGVIEGATGSTLQEYTDEKISSVIGMNGEWIKLGSNNVYWSNAREMARFGLLIMNEGKWEETEVIADKTYYDQMINTSQDLNPAYGYLWWLNGKNTIIYPTSPQIFNTKLAPQAPDDLIAALGKDGQFVDVLPSHNIVVIRMGQAPDESLVPTGFHDDMWGKIMDVIE